MKLFVTTLALAAAVSNGANLRSSVASNTAMQEFMQKYGDQVSVEKEFKHNPQAVLRKFIHEQRTRTLKEHEDIVTSACFSPDGSKIVTASRDKTAKIWYMKRYQMK